MGESLRELGRLGMLTYLGDVVRVAAKQVGPDLQEIVNVFWYEAGLEQPSVEDGEVMDAISLHLDEMYLAFAQWIVASQTADDIDYFNVTQNRPMGSVPWPTYTGGTAIGDYLPPGIAALITGGTAIKRVQPKKYLGVGMENSQAQGQWSGVMLTAMATFGASWLTDVAMGVLGSMYVGTWRRAVLQFAHLTSVVAKAVCSYQRRRKPGVGS